MKIALLIDFVLLVGVGFIDWLVPRTGQRTRELFEDWWLKFSDLNYTRTGSFVAGLLSRRIDMSFGSRTASPGFLFAIFIFSQTIFVLVLIWVALAWGALPTINVWDGVSALWAILLRLRHCFIPLLALNTIFDMASLAVTRHILRKAAESTELAKYSSLIALDMTIATAFVLLSAIFFANFYFAPGLLTGILLFFVYLGCVPAVMFLILGPIAIRWELKGELSKDTSKNPAHVPVDAKEGDATKPDLPKGVGIGLAILLIGIALVIVGLAIKNSFYVSFLTLDWSDISLVLIISVSFTAIIPSILNLLLLIGIFILRLLSGPAHAGVSHFLLRLAETPRGLLYLIVAVLAAVKDLFTILLVNTGGI